MGASSTAVTVTVLSTRYLIDLLGLERILLSSRVSALGHQPGQQEAVAALLWNGCGPG